VLDVGRRFRADAGLNRVVATTSLFDRIVASIVEIIGVIAGAAGQPVGARAAI
jgi:hypothetical protein